MLHYTSHCLPLHSSSAGPNKGEQTGIGYNKSLKVYTVPSPLALSSARIVQRTAALVGGPYVPAISYNGCQKAKSLLGALIATCTLALTYVFFVVPPLRWVLMRFLPKPGEGPSQELLDTGFIKVVGVGTGDGKDGSEAPAEVRVKFDLKESDPGYKGTALMVTEAAMCLLEGTNEQAPGAKVWNGGVLTPGAAFGGALVKRLNNLSNVVVEVVKEGVQK